MSATIERGNIVVSDRARHAIVLAVRKDGTRAKLYVYGPDAEMWLPVGGFTVEVNSDSDECYKCSGSGLFYMGGMVLNGVYTGKTGPCFACSGKGTQDNADRLRCHYYWHRKGSDIEDRPLDASPAATMPDSKPAELVDCEACGCLHRSDVKCAW